MGTGEVEASKRTILKIQQRLDRMSTQLRTQARVLEKKDRLQIIREDQRAKAVPVADSFVGTDQACVPSICVAFDSARSAEFDSDDEDMVDLRPEPLVTSGYVPEFPAVVSIAVHVYIDGMFTGPVHGKHSVKKVRVQLTRKKFDAAATACRATWAVPPHGYDDGYEWEDFHRDPRVDYSLLKSVVKADPLLIMGSSFGNPFHAPEFSIDSESQEGRGLSRRLTTAWIMARLYFLTDAGMSMASMSSPRVAWISAVVRGVMHASTRAPPGFRASENLDGRTHTALRFSVDTTGHGTHRDKMAKL